MRERSLKDLTVPMACLGLSQVEGAGRGPPSRRLALRAPYPVAHVRIGRIGDPSLAQIAQMANVFLDLLVTVGQPKRDRWLVVNCAVPKTVDDEPVGLKQLPAAGIVFVAGLVSISP